MESDHSKNRSPASTDSRTSWGVRGQARAMAGGAVVTKLADRGSVESTGIVTDVGLFLNLLDSALAGEP